MDLTGKKMATSLKIVISRNLPGAISTVVRIMKTSITLSVKWNEVVKSQGNHECHAVLDLSQENSCKDSSMEKARKFLQPLESHTCLASMITTVKMEKFVKTSKFRFLS